MNISPVGATINPVQCRRNASSRSSAPISLVKAAEIFSQFGLGFSAGSSGSTAIRNALKPVKTSNNNVRTEQRKTLLGRSFTAHHMSQQDARCKPQCPQPRMGGDSNPRYLSVNTLSRRAHSTTLPPILFLRGGNSAGKVGMCKG